MMAHGTFRAIFSPEALQDVKALDNSVQKKVLSAVESKIQVAPYDYGLPLGKRASGNLPGLYKLSVAGKSVRIIYEIVENRRVSVLWVIAARSDDQCYRLAYRRLGGPGSDRHQELLKKLLNMTKRE